MATLKDQSVHTGNSIAIMIDGKVVGRATSISKDIDFGLQPVNEIGEYMPVEHVYTQYQGSIAVEGLKVRKKDVNAVGLSLGEEVLKAGVINMMVIDKVTNEVIESFIGCSLANASDSIAAGDIATESSTWYYLSAKKG